MANEEAAEEKRFAETMEREERTADADRSHEAWQLHEWDREEREMIAVWMSKEDDT